MDDKSAEHGRRPEDERAIPYQAPALEKGLQILELLAGAAGPHSLPELAKALSRSKTELYRMAVVLERTGYIERTSDDRFFLTNRLFDLAMRSPPLRNLVDAALPVMHRLAEHLTQSCHLAVASGDEIVVVARVESPGQVGFAVRIGYRRHLVQAASGVVIFGLQPDSIRRRWLSSLRKSAPLGSDIDGFLKAADAARRTQHHAGQSAVVNAITDIGCPVFDGDAPGPTGALTVPFLSGPATKGTVDSAMGSIEAAAEEISRTLQHG